MNELITGLLKDHALKVEEFLRLGIKLKPKWWPKWYWKQQLNRLIYLERSGIKFTEASDE